MNKKIREAPITITMLIVLTSCVPTPVPLPEWPTQTPAPAPPPIVYPVWKGVVLQSICLELDQAYRIAGEPYFLESASEDPLNIKEPIEDFLGDLGIEVSPDVSSCDGVVKVSLRGNTIAGVYSGLGTCHNGIRISVQLTLVIDEHEVPGTWYTAIKDPPHTVGSCSNIKSPDKFSRHVLLKAMFFPLVEPWGSNAYGSALVNVHHTPDQVQSSLPDTPYDELRISSVQTEISPEEFSVAVPFLIQALNDPDEIHRSFAVTALGYIGPPAREAVPYIIRSWEEYGETSNSRYVLNKLAGSGGSLEEWKKWWNDNYEDFLTE